MDLDSDRPNFTPAPKGMPINQLALFSGAEEAPNLHGKIEGIALFLSWRTLDLLWVDGFITSVPLSRFTWNPKAELKGISFCVHDKNSHCNSPVDAEQQRPKKFEWFQASRLTYNQTPVELSTVPMMRCGHPPFGMLCKPL